MPTSDDPRRSPGRKEKPAADPPGPLPPSRRERWCLAALCALGAARIFFGAAALPFFADTDEYAHFDLVLKFARGYWPDKNAVNLDPATVDVWLPFGTTEFLKPPAPFLGMVPVNVTHTGPDEAKFLVARNVLLKWGNFEAQSPPVYYLVAGFWYDLGLFAGLTGPRGVYWVRFLNVPLFAALVALAYAVCRPRFGRDTALAVAALTAFFPNTVFFTVNSDILSPVTAALTLLLLLRWYEREAPAPGLSAAVGAAAAAAVLVKLTNAALLGVVGAVILLRLRRDRRPVATLRAAGPLLLAAALPLAVWGVRNRVLLGDWTGTAAKVKHLTWTPKPWNELLDHPLFTRSGPATFLTPLTTRFFCGDSVWCGKDVHEPLAEKYLLATTAVLPALGLAVCLWRGRREPRARTAAAVAALTVAGYLFVLTYLSLRFDFGQCMFPRRDFPYFATGRLVAGAIVPLLTLYACGLGALAGRRTVPLAAGVGATVWMMVLAQQVFLRLALPSTFNWFHLT